MVQFILQVARAGRQVAGKEIVVPFVLHFEHAAREEPQNPGVVGADPASLFLEFEPLLEGALEWVANNTPEDTTTQYLEARVTFTDNGRGPLMRVFRSVDRMLVLS